RHSIEVVIDRLKVVPDRRSRLTESVEAALRLSDGYLLVVPEGGEERMMTDRYACARCELAMPQIEPRLFSFNSPFGACPDCSGLGSHERFSEELAIDPDRSIDEGAIIPWRTKPFALTKVKAFARAHRWDLSPKWRDLPKEVRAFIWEGSGDERAPMTFEASGMSRSYMGRYEGLAQWLATKWQDTESENVMEELAAFREEDECKSCRGLRLRPEALNVKVGGWGIGELLPMPVERLARVVRELDLRGADAVVVEQLLNEIRKRLDFLVDVGVGYLSLLRRADTLSGGESQRIRLATQIGSELSGVLYVLDEPTIGLHSRDTERLVRSLSSIRDLDNTVVVVEHDRETMKAADHIIEMGPGAGERGGEVLRCGPYDEVQASDGLTGPYLRGAATGIVLPEGGKRRKGRGALIVRGAAHNNLKGVDVTIPCGTFTCISGVSGSGKSSLLYDVLYKGLRRRLDRDFRERAGKHGSMEGDAPGGALPFDDVVLVDQSPIGRTPRSNPATYT
ncbi:MAG: excinuclease ABC subunit UvrA, partial [Synergistaceae bacterium]|nr:excinuclease ABC subunit UvrA [Synergistaceae bacterium]